MTPELATYLMGVFAVIIGWLIKQWVGSVNKRLAEGNRAFEEIKIRLARVEERCRIEHQHHKGDDGDAER